MRSRSKVTSMFAALTLAGAALAAGSAGASSDTTEPMDTEPMDTEAEGTEPMGTEAESGVEVTGTEPMGTEPAGEIAGGEAGAGSGSDSGVEGADLAGTSVTVFGIEDSEQEAGAQDAALAAFTEETGIEVTYTGVRTFEADIGTLVAGGNPPDIALFPQPGRLAGFAVSGDALALPDDTLASVNENWSGDWMGFGNVEGTQYGVPVKSDLKSLVWYVPAAFAEGGYEVPTTLDDFFALTEEMAANGDTPLCVGIESGTATGWPFTDWVEDLILRNQGIDFYNQWVAHEVPFNSPEVVDTFQQIADLWLGEGMTYAAGGSIVSTNFNDNAQPLIDGDCMMHRQASFFPANFTGIADFGEDEGQYNFFYFPSNEGQPVLSGGLIGAAFRDAPEVWAVMDYLGSPEYVAARQPVQTELAGGGNSGYLSANLNADLSVFNEVEQSFIEILQTGSPVAFDASDNMPAEPNAAFWSGGTSLINGDVTAQEAADSVEAAWPAPGEEEAPATTSG